MLLVCGRVFCAQTRATWEQAAWPLPFPLGAFSLASVRWLAPACIAGPGKRAACSPLVRGWLWGSWSPFALWGKASPLSLEHAARESCLGLATTASVSHCAGRPLCLLNYYHCGARLGS